jgi:putative SOS response-associated peptidase YedK
MCGRFTHRLTWKQIVALYGLTGDQPFELNPRYNVAPSQMVPVVRERDGKRELALLRWGLIPSWAKEASIAYKMINARAEKVAAAPSYRAAFKARRCIIPASGFYEWQQREKGKQPFLIQAKDGGLLSLAGLWERWEQGAEPIETFTIITTTPNELMAPIHDRMPVILEPDAFDAWLAPGASPIAEALLQPYPADKLEVCPISTRANSPKNDDPAIIEPLVEGA